ncbi:MAG TPA: alpha/beta hydrolase [Herpetosiphonaceae bacterium]|nr:alpha/beta hydrolase [Herpetosiphonaceae bacterium]
MTSSINEILLWPHSASTAGYPAGLAKPSLTVFEPLPGRATGAAIIVCPGGGYMRLADHEAVPVAEWLATLGITAVLLRYRLAPHARHPAMLEDGQRAIRTVRDRAIQWNVDAGRIGILGFSAGGHLASTTATHFDGGDPQAADPVERVSSRPDLAILIYPVITLSGPFAHAGSRDNLLGNAPGEALVRSLSSELQVSPETPPMFLVHASADEGVPCENCLLMAGALSRARVPFELHIYQGGRHGFGMESTAPGVSPWTDRCAEWLCARGFAGQTDGLRRT